MWLHQLLIYYICKSNINIRGIERKSRDICARGRPVASIAVHQVIPSELVTTGALFSHSSSASTGVDLFFNVPKYFANKLLDTGGFGSNRYIST
jgi:hypothetical protein